MSIRFTAETINRLREASSIVVLTGAGISAESGVPTFRDKGGHWAKHKPEDLASEAGFRRDPVLVQSWYRERTRKLESIQPNPGHLAIAELENRFNSFLLVTQNVDNLHHRAGSTKIIEVHGNLSDQFCIECGLKTTQTLADADELPMTCSACRGLIRPGVVWFGEMLPTGAFEHAVSAARECDVLLSIGTSGVVYPVAMLPEFARQNGAYTIEVNIERSAISHVMNDTLIGPSGMILPQLLDATFAESPTAAPPTSTMPLVPLVPKVLPSSDMRAAELNGANRDTTDGNTAAANTTGPSEQAPDTLTTQTSSPQ